MSRELMESLARQADAGGALFDDRASAVVEPARARVRRTRRLRAAGTAGAAALVVAAGVVGATMLGGDGSPLAPAGPAPTATPHAALTAEDLMTNIEVMRRTFENAPGQLAAVCSMEPRDNPWSAQAQAEFMTLYTDCARMWVPGTNLLVFEAATLRIDDTGVTADWEVRNISDVALVLDPAASTVALSAPEGVDVTPWVSDHRYAGTPLWLPDNMLGVVLSSGSAPQVVEGGETLSGTQRFEVGQQVDGEPDMIAMIIAGEITPSLSVQLRVPPQQDPGTTELFFHLETDLLVAARDE
jgi:hypothetical protein